MENIEKVFSSWQLHPVIDHFSIALLVVAVAIDLAALVFSNRPSLRHTALTLMIIGAVAAAGSYWTGDMEGDRVWDLVKDSKVHDVLKLHAQIGYYLMLVFAALALWRILIEFVGFMRSTGQIYLVVAVLAVAALLYQGSLGGELVYRYGVGTQAMAASASAVAAEQPKPAQPTTVEAPTPIPTVYVPTAAPTPTAGAEASPAPSAEPTAAPEKSESSESPEKSPEPSAQPSAAPSV
jgi:uncharacterized membrane protein